jgi:hypothetical protein
MIQREKAVRCLDDVWRLAQQTNGTDDVLPTLAAMAIAEALLYVGDGIADLRGADS